ncbi:Acg family FMN-binding oxidoreductase [Nocardia flavorosea]|uniref:NAD(P)H nitroreductase n=1 Tax=Nocardia flavorosea TaxID=53429 RepID=A0A846YPV8_9NOCA|nr:hypothetical protein [Nocardia flavorosea]NKY59368.1 NAD(P)H nitroreductase [Nocardia flavorosea]
MTGSSVPGPETVHSALALASRAPSVHNSQPWLWRLGGSTVHLYADTSRHLPFTDPDSRDLLLSCGAVLHHFRIAAHSLGWRTIVHRLPNPDDPQHLASIEFVRATPDSGVLQLARAINRRHTDRRRVTSWQVSPGHIATLLAAATDEGADALDVTEERQRSVLREAFTRAADRHQHDDGYRAELSRWSGHYATADGVPARNAVVAADPLTREFRGPTMQQVVDDTIDGAHLLLVHTRSDDRLARLQAGETTSAVLLSATELGLATCPLSEPFEIGDTREQVRTEVLHGSGYPQIVLRVGWASTRAPSVPVTPRRPLTHMVKPL